MTLRVGIGTVIGVVLVAVAGWMLWEHAQLSRHAKSEARSVGFWVPLLGGLFGMYLIIRLPMGMGDVSELARLVSFTMPGWPGQAAALPAAPTATAPRPTAAPKPTAAPSSVFAPYWVKNHRLAEMWSGPVGQEGVISFGVTSSQFCSFQVVRPQNGSRLYVLNPFSNNYFWIDADAIGPAPGPPARRPGPVPGGVNCAEVVFER